MDICDEIKLSKGDMLSDSDDNKHRNKLPGVKAIDRVSSIKSKSKDTGKSNSPKSRCVLMSERVLSRQPVTQYNPITSEVRKESEKAAVVKKNSVVSKSKVAAVVSEKSTVVNESVVKSIEKSTVVKERDVTSKVGKSNVLAVVSEKSDVDEKDNPKVSKVSDESNKATVVAPVIENVPVATETDKETELVVVADVKAPVVAAVESVVEKDNPKVTSKVLDESVKALVIKESVKVPVVKKSVKASSVVTDKPSSVVADKTDVVDYSSDEADRKRKKLKIKASLKRKRIGSDSSDSLKIDTKSIKRLISKLEKKVKKQESDEDSVPKKGKRKLTKKVEKEVSDKESLPKKGNKNLTKKFKKEESDEVSIPKKGKKKEKQLTPKEAAHEEYLSRFSSLHKVSIDHLPSKLGWFAVSKFKSYMLSLDSGDKIRVTPSKIHDMLGVPFGGYSLFDLDEREPNHEFVRKWAGQFYPLEL
nr:peptidase C48, SUMO/sentrin/Ubl1 [Tanacetum cinerariifolium]